MINIVCKLIPMYHNHLKRFSKLILILFALSFPFISSAQSDQDLIKAFNSKLIPIRTLSPDSDYTDLQPLTVILKNKHVIGLGEATHATKEFYIYKHRLVEFLVKDMGFKTLVIEGDFAGTQVMNDYVLYEKGSAWGALQKTLLGVAANQEFFNMVEWIKQYNSDKPFKDKVKFYGCDMNYGVNTGIPIKNALAKSKIRLSADATKGLDLLINYRNNNLSKDQSNLMHTAVKELDSAKWDETVIPDMKIFKQYIRCMEQLANFADQHYIYDKDIVRDKYMAENCEWIYNYESANKMIIWAHNLHIAKDITKNNNLPMGYYLNQQFQDAYYALGFGFTSGKLITNYIKPVIYDIPPVSIKNSSDYIFSQCMTPNFILDFKSSESNPSIVAFLNKKIHSRSVGAIYFPDQEANGDNGAYQKLIKMYDGIIFIKTTNAVTLLKSYAQNQ
jgi:erythromycin esterase